jgi:hypothetical protein
VSPGDHFYVRREECWGGTFVWIVYDRDTRRQAHRPFKTEAPARKLCTRMNADWQRYRWAMAGKAS